MGIITDKMNTNGCRSKMGQLERKGSSFLLFFSGEKKLIRVVRPVPRVVLLLDIAVFPLCPWANLHVVGLVSWCFEPSQPHRITSGLRGGDVTVCVLR